MYMKRERYLFSLYETKTWQPVYFMTIGQNAAARLGRSNRLLWEMFKVWNDTRAIFCEKICAEIGREEREEKG